MHDIIPEMNQLGAIETPDNILERMFLGAFLNTRKTTLINSMQLPDSENFRGYFEKSRNTVNNQAE